jgi:pilus assembly protein CpaE
VTKSLIGAIGGDVRVVGSLLEVDDMLAIRHELLVVVGADIDLDDAVDFTTRHRSACPVLGVVLLREQLDVTVLGRAIRAGARDVVADHDLDQVADACWHSLDLSHSTPMSVQIPPRQTVAGKIAVVFATKGGCGKTVMATNLAVALHAGGTRRVCLVDLDLAFGDVATSLQLNPIHTLVDAVALGERMDETAVAGLLTRYRPGLECLLAPVEPGDAEKVSASLIGDLLLVLRTMFDYIVVDAPPRFNEHALAALDAADHHVLLTNPDMPTLKNLRVTLDMLDLLSYPRDERSVVLNREDPRAGLTVADVEAVAKTAVAARIPASLDVSASINRGVPITVDFPEHRVSVAIRDFADRVIVGGAMVVSPARRPFLARLRRRSA